MCCWIMASLSFTLALTWRNTFSKICLNLNKEHKKANTNILYIYNLYHSPHPYKGFKGFIVSFKCRRYQQICSMMGEDAKFLSPCYYFPFFILWIELVLQQSMFIFWINGWGGMGSEGKEDIRQESRGAGHPLIFDTCCQYPQLSCPIFTE